MTHPSSKTPNNTTSNSAPIPSGQPKFPFTPVANSFVHNIMSSVTCLVGKEKKYGGLGIRDCEKWNKAALGKFVWKVAMKKDSLWVKWVNSVYLHNRDWWTYSPKNSDGWAWKKICGIKEELKAGFTQGPWKDSKYTIASGYRRIVLKFSGQTRVKLKKYEVCDSDLCLLYGSQPKDQHHLFFDCPYSRICLTLISKWLHIPDRRFDIEKTWKHWKRAMLDCIKRKSVFVVLTGLVYCIWMARNETLWNKAVIHPRRLCYRLCTSITDRIQQVISSKWNRNHYKWLYERKRCIPS
ncbi:uncharacterized protein LOC110691302 [Chenopodium quinoa]|uniref:uncharacterized protein LOC110691302 n=1 Tax=Chenopodium quinoa TaxID=63459 RepID=UPI000B770C71|nr:uncharacterized protein LOC110691302 [Chenopodium quinoa]